MTTPDRDLSRATFVLTRYITDQPVHVPISVRQMPRGAVEGLIHLCTLASAEYGLGEPSVASARIHTFVNELFSGPDGIDTD